MYESCKVLETTFVAQYTFKIAGWRPNHAGRLEYFVESVPPAPPLSAEQRKWLDDLSIYDVSDC